MSAGVRYEYHWQDSNSSQYRKPTKMCAPDYVDCLMTWTQGMLDNEEVFPSKVGEYAIVERKKTVNMITTLLLILSTGVPFPDNFQATVKSILRRLFRVYAHIYNHHFAQICALSLEGEFLVVALFLAVTYRQINNSASFLNSTLEHQL